MEIIHLILGKANPNRMNGINKVVNSLATYQSNSGLDVSVWGITPTLIENFPERNYKTELFESFKNKFTICNLLIDKIKKTKPGALFHIHGGFIPEFFHLSRTLKSEKFDYIFTPHGAYNHKAMERSKYLKLLYYNMIDKTVVNNAKALHCLGQSELNSIKEISPDSNCVLIPNGQNIEELNFNYKNLKKDNTLVFGFCGRIDIYTKGLDYLVKGFANFINKKDGRAELWVIGDGSELNTLKLMADNLGVRDNVKFFGEKFGDEKLNIMANMDVFYHPSRNEGLPGAVLEASALSVPCVVSEESNMADFIRKYNAGICIKKTNENTIADSMQSMYVFYHNNEIKRLKNNSLSMIREEFDWKNITKKLLKVYVS